MACLARGCGPAQKPLLGQMLQQIEALGAVPVGGGAVEMVVIKAGALKVIQRLHLCAGGLFALEHRPEPQIAALGSHHYRVYKEDDSDSTTSRMQLLTDEQRVMEIAQMLSGNNITEAAINNAKELLQI